MAVEQVGCSFQNDGNYSQLDVKDLQFGGPTVRIETFRCSQPEGEYGTSAAGTPVEFVAGTDHLTESSNRVFRHVFSVERDSSQQVLLEFRETFSEDGSFDVRTRDLDPASETFGSTLLVTSAPKKENRYTIGFELRVADSGEPIAIESPLVAPVSEQVRGLVDIGGKPTELGELDSDLDWNPLVEDIVWSGGVADLPGSFSRMTHDLTHGRYDWWARNVQAYERFGDFRDKAVHAGTNLVGDQPQLASEYMLIRAYRASMIVLGRAFDDDMLPQPDGSNSVLRLEEPLQRDPKPGVYSVFLNAYVLNNSMYQLALDKVHSDYGGVPMVQGPGSRLETGGTPIVDSTRFNRALAELAYAFFVETPLPALGILASSVSVATAR